LWCFGSSHSGASRPSRARARLLSAPHTSSHPRDALDALYRQLHRVQTDAACKAHSLVLDHKCADSRRKLVVPAEKVVPRVDTFNRTTNRAPSPPRAGQLELG